MRRTFLLTPLVRRPATKDLEKEHKKFGRKKTGYTDADGRVMHWKIARRKRYAGEQMTDRGRTNGGRQGLSQIPYCEVQLYFNLDTHKDFKGRELEKKVDIQWINIPLRVSQQKSANYELTNRSAWHRDGIEAAVARLSRELHEKEEKAHAAAKTLKLRVEEGAA